MSLCLKAAAMTLKVGQIEAAVTAMNLSMQGQFDSLKV